MSVESIPAEHLRYLIETLLADSEQRDALLEKATSHEPKDRDEVLHALDQVKPGTSKQLTDDWEFSSRSAFFMWRVNALGELDSEDEIRPVLLAALSRALKKPAKSSSLGEDWLEIPRGDHKPESGYARVARVRLRAGMLRAVVFIDRPSTVTYEESPDARFRTSAVDVALDLRSQVPLLRGMATKTDAKKAVFAFLAWLLDKPVPSRSNEQAEWAEPLTFNEAHIRQLKKKLELRVFEYDGDAADGSGMKKRLRGGLLGAQPAALDEEHPEVKEMDECELDRRGLYFSFQHEDGYTELIQVRFYMDPKQAHIVFRTHTSRPAMDYVIQQVYSVTVRGSS